MLVVGVTAALLLGACGHSGAVDTTTSTTPSTTTSLKGPATATSCGRAAAASSTTLIDKVAGHVRTVIVHLPSGYSGASRVALVLNLHGSGTTAVDQELFSGMDATSDAHGFIVAYPQGLIPQGTGFDWNVPGEPLVSGAPVPANAPDDVIFLTKLVGVLEHHYCIDPARVYATGFSGGARTASQLACDASSVFAAVAPVSGLRHPSPCPATRAVPVLSFHGTADPVDPYGGHGLAYWTYSVPQAALEWARQDGCRTVAATSHPDPAVTLTEYTGCRARATVALYTVAGEGHEWPGGPALPKRLTRVLGAVERDRRQRHDLGLLRGPPDAVTPEAHTIGVGGVRRSFLLAAPAAGVSAVLLSLHGTRSSAAEQARLSRMAGLADSAGVVVVFPEAIVPVGSGFEWDHDGDMPYLRQLVAEVLGRYPTPTGRVCMAGMSGGARMACHFASCDADAVTMVGAVAGLRAPDGPALARPVPVLAFHGTADRINPYEGSGSARWGESVPQAARRWAVANGAPLEPVTAAVSPTLTRTTYGGDGERGEVSLWTARGSGHTWPGTRLGPFLRLFLGRTTTEIDASAQIWTFAQRHSADL